jgi:hypothetical protein
MRKLMAYVAALGAAPIVAIAVAQTAAPALADTPGVSPTCFPQSANPHPTDPVGQTTNTLFCTSTTPSGTGSGGSGSGGSGGSASTGRTGGGTAAGTTAGGAQASMASTSDSSGSFPDESGRALNGTWSGSGQPAASNNTGLFGGLVGFFSSAGGLAFLFGLLMLMLIVLIALAVVAAIRRGGKNFASRFSRVSYRA